MRLVPVDRKTVSEGDVFGYWTVLGEPFYVRFTVAQPMVVAKCRCGRIEAVRTASLTNGTSRSCGCYRIEKISGQKSTRNKRPCGVCGKDFYTPPSSMKRFCSYACRKMSVHPKTTHGESNTRLHGIWCHMKTRCLCKTAFVYRWYGARGIAVCNEWVNSYEAFRDWALSNGYRDDLEIDRINCNGNYEPSNCRWATRIQQIHNRRKRQSSSTTSRFKGVSWSSGKSRWIAQATTNKQPHYVGSFRTEVEAALAYDDFIFVTRGEFANLNFPERKRQTEVSHAVS